MSPHAGIEGQIPDELWFGRKVNVKHLRVFGCPAYAHVPKAKRGKFDVKSEPRIFIGYCDNVKGYKLLDPVTKKISISGNVLFDEKFESVKQTQEDSDHAIIFYSFFGDR